MFVCECMGVCVCLALKCLSGIFNGLNVFKFELQLPWDMLHANDAMLLKHVQLMGYLVN